MNAPETHWKSQATLPLNALSTIFRPQRNLHQRRRELTLQNAECGITLNVGENLELDLGLVNGSWRVRDESILATDGSGTFQALECGKTKIYVTGELSNDNAGAMHVPRKLLIEIPVTII